MAMPLGIQQLTSMEALIVKQKRTVLSGNKYVVLNPDGSEVLHAKEDSLVLLGGSSREFNIAMLDQQQQNVIKLHRPYTFGADKLKVYIGGELVSIVRKEATFFKPLFSINDSSNQPVLRVKGEFGDPPERDFKLQCLDKTLIGVIRKKWGGFVKELLTNNTEYHVRFPLDLDVKYKAAVLGTCVLIDFLYYD